MTTPLFLVLTLMPILVGGCMLWLVYRNAHRKYFTLFDQLIAAARKNPGGVMFLLKAGDEAERRGIVESIAAIEKLDGVEVLKAGKKCSQVRLKTRTGNASKNYLVEISKLSADDWGITQFTAD